MATLESRKEKYDIISECILKQIDKIDGHRDVEFISYRDNKQVTVGEKRNVLLRNSKGRFVCFVDDDDRISHDYVESILTCIVNNPTCDCIVFNGIYSVDGSPILKIDYDLKHSKYERKNGFF